MGLKFAKYTKPIKIKLSKLYISAKSPVIVQEINLVKEKILKKANTYANPLGFNLKDLVADYKNYKEKTEEIASDEEINFYNKKSLDDINIKSEYVEEIRQNIDKIKFLSEEQKNKLTEKIINTKKAQIKRMHD